MGTSIGRYIVAERFGVAIAVAYFVLAASVFATSPAAWRPGSDGHYSYIYARSIAFDGDIDFSNDYRLCGDPFRLGSDRGTGRPDNIFFVGPALFWVPMLVALRAFGVPGDACSTPWTTACLSITVLLSALATFITYRFVATQLGRGISAAAVGIVYFGGPALLWSAAAPSYSHVYDLFFSACLCWLSARLQQDPSRRSLILLTAVTLTGLILQRASNLVFLSLPISAVLLSQRRSSARSSALAVLVMCAGALLGLLMLSRIASELHGGPFAFSHGPHFLYFSEMHPLLALFDAEAGLFFFWPATWAAVAGMLIPFRDRSQRAMALGLGGVALFELLLSSSALDWTPYRRLLNLAPAFALFTANALSRIRPWVFEGSQPALVFMTVLGLAPLAMWSSGYAWGASQRLVPTGRPVTQAELYGGGIGAFWTMVDRSLGRLPILPAELWFSARYRKPARAFGDAAFAGWYLRDFRTLAWIDRRIDLQALHRQRLTEGLAGTSTSSGLRMVTTEARAVFATQWPYVTHLLISAESDGPTWLKVGVASPMGSTRWLDPQPVEGKTRLRLDVRRLQMGSGIQEVFFQIPNPGEHVVLNELELDDAEARTPLVPPPDP